MATRPAGAGGKLGGQAQMSGVCKDLTESVNSMVRNTVIARNLPTSS